jgi:hypothetical protein
VTVIANNSSFIVSLCLESHKSSPQELASLLQVPEVGVSRAVSRQNSAKQPHQYYRRTGLQLPSPRFPPDVFEEHIRAELQLLSARRDLFDEARRRCYRMRLHSHVLTTKRFVSFAFSPEMLHLISDLGFEFYFHCTTRVKTEG